MWQCVFARDPAERCPPETDVDVPMITLKSSCGPHGHLAVCMVLDIGGGYFLLCNTHIDCTKSCSAGYILSYKIGLGTFGSRKPEGPDDH